VKGYTKLKDSVSIIAGPGLILMNRITQGTRDTIDLYVNLTNVKKENATLKKKLEALQLENQRLAEFERESQRLKDILSFSQHNPNTLIAAHVTGEDIKNWFKCIIIDKGSNYALREKMNVITPKGLVGQVIEAHRWHAKIMVINDTNSSVDVFIDGRNTRGILEGTGQAKLKLKYVRKTDEAEIGDKLVTSGKDTIYQKGLPVGIITTITRGQAGIFADIDVVPFNDFKKLEEVLVIKK
jgi:rod shape-determining protein MreC